MPRILLGALFAAVASAQPGCRGPGCTGFQPRPQHYIQFPINLDGSQGTPSSAARQTFNATLVNEVAAAVSLTPAHVHVYTLTTYDDPLIFGTVQLSFNSPTSDADSPSGLRPATVPELDVLVLEFLAQLANASSPLRSGSVSSRLRSRPTRIEVGGGHHGPTRIAPSTQRLIDSEAGDWWGSVRRLFQNAGFSFFFVLFVLFWCTAPCTWLERRRRKRLKHPKGLPAGLDPDRMRDAKDKSDTLRPVKLQKLGADAQAERVGGKVTKDSTEGLIKERPPILPPDLKLNWKKDGLNHSLRDYGGSLAVDLYLQFQWEGALLFLLLFILELGSLINNVDRMDLRNLCRTFVAQPIGYEVLVNNATPPWNYTGPPLEDCGYEGLAVRAAEADFFIGVPAFLLPSLGACMEYSNTSTTTLPTTSDTPFLDTPGADFCMDDDSRFMWIQTFSFAMFILFLVRLRKLAKDAAENDDKNRITTGDYALEFAGLEAGVPVESLKARLYKDLERLGYPAEQIAYIEIARKCYREIKVIETLDHLKLKEGELKAKQQAKHERVGTPHDKVDRLVNEVDEKITRKLRKAEDDLRDLLEEEDISTGYAYVVFRFEVDRNRCAKTFAVNSELSEGGGIIFQRIEKEFNRFFKNIYKFVRAKLKGEAVSNRKTDMLKAVHLESGAKPTKEEPDVVPLVELRTAPEPSEVIWENLELSDEWEEKAERFSYAVVTIEIVLGLMAIVLVKRWIATSSLEHLDKHDDDSPVWSALEGLLGLLFSSSASILTICLDFLLRKTLIVLTKREGQDTQTEFEQSIFFKLSFAFIFNSALVPLAAGIFMSWVAGGYGVDQSWYENRGVVYQALVLILINALKEFTKAIPPRTVFSRYVKGQFVYSQAKLDELWQPPKMHTGVLYAETVKLVSLGLIYGPINPLAYMLTFCGLANGWICTRIGISRWYRRPMNVDQEMIMTMRTFMGIVMLLSLVVKVMASYAAFSKSASSRGMAAYAFLPVLWFIYEATPLTAVLPKYFKSSVQEERDLDTAGVPYEEVEEKTGFEMEVYTCPTLTEQSVRALLGPAALVIFDEVQEKKRIAAAGDKVRAARLASSAFSEASQRRSARRSEGGSSGAASSSAAGIGVAATSSTAAVPRPGVPGPSSAPLSSDEPGEELLELSTQPIEGGARCLFGANRLSTSGAVTTSTTAPAPPAATKAVPPLRAQAAPAAGSAVSVDIDAIDARVDARVEAAVAAGVAGVALPPSAPPSEVGSDAGAFVPKSEAGSVAPSSVGRAAGVPLPPSEAGSIAPSVDSRDNFLVGGIKKLFGGGERSTEGTMPPTEQALQNWPEIEKPDAAPLPPSESGSAVSSIPPGAVPLPASASASESGSVAPSQAGKARAPSQTGSARGKRPSSPTPSQIEREEATLPKDNLIVGGIKRLFGGGEAKQPEGTMPPTEQALQSWPDIERPDAAPLPPSESGSAVSSIPPGAVPLPASASNSEASSVAPSVPSSKK